MDLPLEPEIEFTPYMVKGPMGDLFCYKVFACGSMIGVAVSPDAGGALMLAEAEFLNQVVFDWRIEAVDRATAEVLISVDDAGVTFANLVETYDLDPEGGPTWLFSTFEEDANEEIPENG